MKKLLILFSLVFSALFFAQSAKEIIDQNLDNSGGLTNWKLLNSSMLQGKVTLGIKDIYPIKIYHHLPNLTKRVIKI